MGLFDEIVGNAVKDAAVFLGEQGRKLRTQYEEEKNMTDELRQNVQAVEKAAQEGNVDAMCMLAEAYIDGDQLRFDPELACHWWTKAAMAGNVTAMYNLGLLYNGDLSRTFKRDNDQAVYWLIKAIKGGDQDAKKVFDANFKYSSFRGKWVRK